MLEPTTITSKKKLHLARRTMPSVMEDMSVHVDEVDAVGHWEGNTRCETYAAKIPKSAVCALAGFYVGEQYNLPWATTGIPAELQMQISPFAEGALANLQKAPNVNYGTINFLELLQLLRSYFWRVIAAIHQSFPDSALLKWLWVLQSSEAKVFLQLWPRSRQTLEVTAQSDLATGNTFSETTTQSVFVSLTSLQRQSETTMNTVLSHCNQLLRRTEPLSPSKHQDSTSLSFMVVPNAGHDNPHYPSPLPSLLTHEEAARQDTFSTPSAADIIAAFCDPVAALSPEFPRFTAQNCSWSSIFEMIWTAWHEGMIVDGVIQMPPLQLIEHEWGGTKDRSTNKSHLEEARAEQARTRSAVVQEEKKVKKAEKALEAKVS
ncbi:hypothetical protein M405DRAFT_867292 [Rhizopogon salebrosus TDB-379]|nr:hypothetical protein M405DRAFT_867292 [Rhizopogon salebrosus TDB-379]